MVPDPSPLSSQVQCEPHQPPDSHIPSLYSACKPARQVRETCKEDIALLLSAKTQRKKLVKLHRDLELEWLQIEQKMFSHHPRGPGNRSQEGLSGQCADMSYTRPQASSCMWHLQLRCLREMGPREGGMQGRKQKQKEGEVCENKGG